MTIFFVDVAVGVVGTDKSCLYWSAPTPLIIIRVLVVSVCKDTDPPLQSSSPSLLSSDFSPSDTIMGTEDGAGEELAERGLSLTTGTLYLL